MADISAEIAAFKGAVYGEDVRDSLVTLANKLNDEVEDGVSRIGIHPIYSFFSSSAINIDYGNDASGVYIYNLGTWYVYRQGTLVKSFSESTRKSQLSSYLETSPHNVLDTIHIPNKYSLVYDTINKTLDIISTTTITTDYIAIFVVDYEINSAWSGVVDGIGKTHIPLRILDPILEFEHKCPGRRVNFLSVDYITYGRNDKSEFDDRILFKPIFLPAGSIVYARYTPAAFLLKAMQYKQRLLAEVLYKTYFWDRSGRYFANNPEWFRPSTAITNASYSSLIQCVTQSNRDYPYLKIEDDGWYIFYGDLINDTIASANVAAGINAIIPFHNHYWNELDDLTFSINVKKRNDITWKKFASNYDAEYVVYYRCKSSPIHIHKNDTIVLNKYSGMTIGLLLYPTEELANEAYESNDASWTDGSIVNRFIMRPTSGGVSSQESYNSVINTFTFIWDGWAILVVSAQGYSSRNWDSLSLGNIDQDTIINDELHVYTSYYNDEEEDEETGNSSIVKDNLDIQVLIEENAYSMSHRSNRIDRIDRGALPIHLLHFSDNHACPNSLIRAYEFYKNYSDIFDGVICTGDIQYDNAYSEDFVTMWMPVSNDFMYVLGNHDWGRAGGGITQSNLLSMTDAYEMYYEPFETKLSNLGVHLASNKTYWYRDFINPYKANKSVRLIGVDSIAFIYSSTYVDQNQWLVETLESARTLGYTVVIALHHPMYSGRKTPCLYSTTTYTATPEDYPGTNVFASEKICIAVDDFINNGGKFACYLSGHVHQDVFFHSNDYPNQYCVSVTLDSCDYDQNDNDTHARIANHKSQDALNAVSIDTYNTIIKVVRIGCNRDSLLRDRTLLIFNYRTGEILAGEDPKWNSWPPRYGQPGSINDPVTPY